MPVTACFACPGRVVRMRSRMIVVGVVALVWLSLATPTYAGGPAGLAASAKGSFNFQLVGRNPLALRGMNAAPAIYGDHLYVGNRTDGSSVCVGGGTGCPHPRPG